MNEIVKKVIVYDEETGNTPKCIVYNAGTIDISIDGQYHVFSDDEARSMIDALCKVLNEPTREQCFEAGLIYGQQDIRTTLTDYINEFKTNHP
jgi:hypothetical protein